MLTKIVENYQAKIQNKNEKPTESNQEIDLDSTMLRNFERSSRELEERLRLQDVNLNKRKPIEAINPPS